MPLTLSCLSGSYPVWEFSHVLHLRRVSEGPEARLLAGPCFKEWIGTGSSTGISTCRYSIDPTRLPSVFRFPVDTIHDPELRKVEVREALNLAVDCEGILNRFFNGLVPCYANIASPGTAGITPKNSAPCPFDPQRAWQQCGFAAAG